MDGVWKRNLLIVGAALAVVLTGCRSTTADTADTSVSLSTTTVGTAAPETPVPELAAIEDDVAPDAIVGRWELIDLNGGQLTIKPRVLFMLEPDFPRTLDDDVQHGDLLMEGYDGCNQFSGTYEADGDGLTGTRGLTALMGCSLEILDQGTRFTEAAFGAREWSLVDGYLILRAGAGKETRLRPVIPDQATGVWTLVDFDGKAFDPAPSLTFRTNRRVSGNIGCLITGDYLLSGGEVTINAEPPSWTIRPA